MNLSEPPIAHMLNGDNISYPTCRRLRVSWKKKCIGHCWAQRMADITQMSLVFVKCCLDLQCQTLLFENFCYQSPDKSNFKQGFPVILLYTEVWGLPLWGNTNNDICGTKGKMSPSIPVPSYISRWSLHADVHPRSVLNKPDSINQ